LSEAVIIQISIPKMIRILKLQKAVVAIILGVIALVAYKVLVEQKNEASKYFLEAAGVLFIVGAFMFLYPILFSKKDRAGCIELDPELHSSSKADEPSTLA
jgi:drug/metabolite transporter superfamily protein YnfA